MKNKFVNLINVDGTVNDPEKTTCDYEIGDVINVGTYGNQYKCIEKTINKDGTTYHFKQGKTIYTFDW